MRAYGNPKVSVKVWRDKCGNWLRPNGRNTSEALKNFRRGHKKRARREGRAEVQAQLADMHELRDMSIEELRALAASLKELPADLVAELHYRLWDWLAHNAWRVADKSGWPGWDTNWPDQYDKYEERPWCAPYPTFGGHNVSLSCFLCTFNEQFSDVCSGCPMDVAARRYNGHNCYLYGRWIDSIGLDVISTHKWAVSIRDCVRRG